MTSIYDTYAEHQEEWRFIACFKERPTLFPLYITEVEEDYFRDKDIQRFWRIACQYWKETGTFDHMAVIGRMFDKRIGPDMTIEQGDTPFFYFIGGIEWGHLYLVSAATHAARYKDLLHKYASEQIKNLIEEEKVRIGKGESIQEVTEDITAKKSVYQQLLTKKHLTGITQAHKETFSEYIETSNQRDQGIVGAMYGIKELDDITFGIAAGQFVVIGAQQATGKSVFAMNFALRMAKAGKSILFISLEMGKTQVLKRVWSCLEGIPHNDLMYYRHDTATMQKIDALESKLIDMQFDLMCEGGVTVSDIEKRLQKKQYDVVFVDYVQLMRGKGKSRYEEVSFISNGLKNLAMQYDCGFVGLAQLTKEGQKSGRPYAYHLKDSSSLEQDAEVIMLLHKDMEDVDCSDGKAVKLFIEKNRNGTSGAQYKIPVDFNVMQIGTKAERIGF